MSLATGVYRITCRGRVYIGSSVNVRQRWHQHRSQLSKNRHVNAKLQASWNKHGPEAFAFELVEECAPSELISREQHWVDVLSPWFNLCPVTGSTLGHRWTNDQRQKVSEARRGIIPTAETVRARTIGLKRVMSTPLVVAKMRASHLGKRLSEAHKQRLREKALRNAAANRRRSYVTG